jgi:diaminopimelate decarboxylase
MSNPASDVRPGVQTHRLEAGPWPTSTHFLRSGDLSVAGVSLVAIAAEHGTPANVLDLAEFRARCANYRRVFPDAEVAYAGKALLTGGVVRMVDDEGLTLDVCSEGELALAVSAGFPTERLILHGNGKSPALLSRAVSVGVGRIVVDSTDEIESLARVTHGGQRQRVLVRVTPGVDAGTHAAITTGTEDQKFGLSISSGVAAGAVRRILDIGSLELVGVHCHIGSQISATEPYAEAARRTLTFLAALRDELGVVVTQLNVGGGHSIAYDSGDVPLDPESLSAVLTSVLESACRRHSLARPRLTIEPGRAIAGPSGVTIYEVLSVKHTASRVWVSVDGGMSDNPRPTLYGARYTARLFGRVSPAAAVPVTVAGRHCEAGDVLIENAMLPADIRAGDLLAVPATGAYHHSMASNYNLTPRPPLIGVQAGYSRPMVRRETLDDLMTRDLG